MAQLFQWTEDAVLYLRELFNAGASASKSAEALMARFGGKVTRNSVIGKWHRVGLGKPRQGTKAMGGTKQTQQAKRQSPSTVAAFVSHPDPIVVIPTSTRVTVAELGPFDCRFPLGDPSRADFSFCGKQSLIGSSYCPEHRALCYQPPKFRSDWDRRINKAARKLS